MLLNEGENWKFLNFKVRKDKKEVNDLKTSLLTSIVSALIAHPIGLIDKPKEIDTDELPDGLYLVKCGPTEYINLVDNSGGTWILLITNLMNL